MDIRDAIIAYARSWSFIAYRYGGDNPLIGMDCSEYAHRVFAHFKLFPESRDMSSAGMWDHFAKFRVQYPVKAGLVWWAKADKICHVGICSGLQFDGHGNKRFMVLEAAGPGSLVNTIDDAIKYRAWVKERPLDHPRGIDLIGYADPLLTGMEYYKRETGSA